MTLYAFDTSVAIPMLVSTHSAHADVLTWLGEHKATLSGHALAETYSVLTRLPGDIRVAPTDANRLLTDNFEDPLLLGPATAQRLPEVLAERQIAGGAVYDALVALAAFEHATPLATRDGRARSTYLAIGAEVVVVG